MLSGSESLKREGFRVCRQLGLGVLLLEVTLNPKPIVVPFSFSLSQYNPYITPYIPLDLVVSIFFFIIPILPLYNPYITQSIPLK